MPYVTRWGLRHSVYRDALHWGIRLWFGPKGLGREGIRFGMHATHAEEASCTKTHVGIHHVI